MSARPFIVSDMHRLTDINLEARTALCEECGPVTIRRKGGSRRGHGYRCNRAHGNASSNGKQRRYRRYKGTGCSRCSLVPEDPCQLDVHHIDGDHSNDSPENLTTLCANCHRLAHHAPDVFAR